MQGTDLKLPTSPPLGATFAVPDAPGAAALIVQGSGVHDRDGNMPAVGFRSTLYKRVARELGERGIATLRFDKRGHDKPADAPQDYSIPQRLNDLRAALAVLRDDERTGSLPLFLIGHSEGAMMVAKLAETESVRGVVSLAAPFGNTFELGKERARRLLSLSGAQQAKGELAIEYYDRLEAFFKEGARLLPEEFVEFARPYKGAPYQGWESYEWLAGHWANALKADPTSKGVPMLVVQGGRDARLWPDNPQRWEAWCATRELADYVLIDHMGHDLNDARQKAFRVDDAVLQTVGDWLLEHAKS
ncbi:MAG: alpha/beta fold hydrolase [Planctomycetes bacterium]|nr:alpha/beta fold hydrolase [Planctomycetota bacterium]